MLSSPSTFIASFDTLTVLGVGGVFIPTSHRDMTLVVSSAYMVWAVLTLQTNFVPMS